MASPVIFLSAEESSQAASAGFIQEMRQTLQKAQEITQVISEAESIAEDATKFCEAIQAQHLVQSKKLALTGKPQATAATACSCGAIGCQPDTGNPSLCCLDAITSADVQHCRESSICGQGLNVAVSSV
ncbi:unnamed protein product [Durusdinium trenchii]|uniref:Uncharacterized protein n=1 Tax=Durusdinium trenchii TaxID=1381693 RepID=A0ABP0L5V3_9DINO